MRGSRAFQGVTRTPAAGTTAQAAHPVGILEIPLGRAYDATVRAANKAARDNPPSELRLGATLRANSGPIARKTTTLIDVSRNLGAARRRTDQPINAGRRHLRPRAQPCLPSDSARGNIELPAGSSLPRCPFRGHGRTRRNHRGRHCGGTPRTPAPSGPFPTGRTPCASGSPS
jgi:hypothetical protein